MSRKKSWWRSWEITVDSNWITTALMAVLLFAVGASLISEVRHSVNGNAIERVLYTKDLFPNVVNLMIAVCFFLGAFQFRAVRPAGIAFVLMGINFASRLALGYLHASIRLQHVVGITGSALRQIALTLALVAILQWFKSAVRWIPPSNSGADS